MEEEEEEVDSKGSVTVKQRTAKRQGVAEPSWHHVF